MENTMASSKDTPVDTTLTDGFTSNAGLCINSSVLYGAGIGAGNLGQLQLSCAGVWERHISARTN